MQVLATIAKTGTHGDRFTWQFCRDGCRYYATNGGDKVIDCRNRSGARRFYKRMIEYGFWPVD